MTKSRQNRRTCVLVLGMHRSGTSALSGVLNCLGVDAPATLMPAHATNPKGFFESDKVWKYQEALLSSAGSSWDDWREINPGWFSSGRMEEFLERGLELLKEEFSDSPLFVLKDPRICRLMPFWKALLAEAAIIPKALHIHRNPIEVASSLQKRDGIDPSYSYLLWMRHVLDAEYGSRNLPRHFTSYTLLLEGWARVVTEAERSMKLSWPRLPELAAAEVGDFLTSDLKHHAERVDLTLTNPTLSSWMRDTLEIVERWSRKGEDSADYPRLDGIREMLNASGPAFGGLLTRGRETARRVEMAKSELAASAGKIAERDGALESLRGELGKAQECLGEVQTAKVALEAARDEERRQAQADLDAERAAKDKQIATLCNEIEKADAARQAAERLLAETLTKKNARERRLAEDLRASEAAIATLRDELGASAEVQDLAARRLEELATQLAELASVRTAQQESATELQAALTETEDRLGGIDALHDEAQLRES